MSNDTSNPISGQNYHPNSHDAIIARLFARMDYQDKLLQEIRDQVTRTNGRVTSLEHERWRQRGVIAATFIICAGLWEIFTHIIK